VIVDAIGGPDAHAGSDLAKRGRVAPIANGLADEIEDHLLTLGEPLHCTVQILNARSIVNKRDNEYDRSDGIT
jgi:hypothetical protein